MDSRRKKRGGGVGGRGTGGTGGFRGGKDGTSAFPRQKKNRHGPFLQKKRKKKKEEKKEEKGEERKKEEEKRKKEKRRGKKKYLSDKDEQGKAVFAEKKAEAIGKGKFAPNSVGKKKSKNFATKLGGRRKWNCLRGGGKKKVKENSLL